MAGIAKAIIIGNLGRDPEMRYLPSGQPVTNFSVAASRTYKTAEGESREETEWFRVSCFGRLAEVANEYLAKGRQVYVEGRLRTGSWEDQQTGEKRFRLEVVASELQMLGARGEAQGQEPGALGQDQTDLDTMPF